LNSHIIYFFFYINAFLDITHIDQEITCLNEEKDEHTTTAG